MIWGIGEIQLVTLEEAAALSETALKNHWISQVGSRVDLGIAAHDCSSLFGFGRARHR
jgi:hypothetical protein